MMRVNFSGPVFQKWDPLSLFTFFGGYFSWCGFHHRLGIVLWSGYCSVSVSIFCNTVFLRIIVLHEKFLQFDWLRAVVFQLNLKHLHVKITNLLQVVV